MMKTRLRLTYQHIYIFFCIIYWACSSTLGSTTCCFSNYVHRFPAFRSKSIDSINAQNSFWCFIMRSCLLAGQVPICCFMTSRWALVFAQWNRRWSMIGIHCCSYMSLPHSGETSVGMPSSSHAQSAQLLFLGWALFWILVCLELWESIVWLL